MNRFYEIFGKVALVILLLIIIGGGIYYLGVSKGRQSTDVVVTPTVMPTEKKVSPTAANPKGNLKVKKTVTAGKDGPVFHAYTITVLDGWQSNHESGDNSDKLTISKDGYQLVISQAAGGAGSCLFPGDPSQEMAQEFTSGVAIDGVHYQYKRGTSDNKSYTICEKKSSAYAFPTSYGYITYTVPAAADNQTISEMDEMVASL